MNTGFKWLIVSITLLKVVCILFVSEDPATFENHSIAVNFLSYGTMFYDHDGNKDFNHQFPLFDLFLTLTYLISGTSLKAALILQVIFNLLSCIFVYYNSEKITNNLGLKISWLPYAMSFTCCLHPFFLCYQLFLVHPLILDILILMFLVLMSFQYLESPVKINFFLLILTAGLVSIERFTLLAGVVPFLILTGIKRKIFIRYLSAIGIGILFFSGSWVMRNYYHTGHFQLTSGIYRYLWIGSLEETQGTNYVDKHTNYYHLLDNYNISLQGLTLNEQSSQYKKSYIERWKNESTIMVKMFFVKCRTFWWFPGHAGSQHVGMIQRYLFLYKIIHGFLLLFAIVGILTSGKRALIWLSLPVALCVIQAVFYMEVRHRMPAEFVLWLFAFVGIWLCMKRFYEPKPG